MSATIKAGTVFTHKHVIHPDDYHLPTKEARKAEMRVTKATRDRVYYTYATSPEGTKAHWWMPRNFYLETYANGS